MLPLLALAFALAQEGPAFEPEPYVNVPFEVRFGKPQGFEAVADETGLLVHKAGVGFRVTREPMLADPETFADEWAATLAAGGISAKVVATKVGKHQAWNAGWEADAGGARRIETWRIHAPDGEWLYNFRFSFPKGQEGKPLVEGVLRQFASTAPRPKLEIPDRAHPIEGRWYVRLPKGFEPVRSGEVRLGGGMRSGFVKLLPGFEPPHVAAHVSIGGFDPTNMMRLDSGAVIAGSKFEEIAADALAGLREEFAKPPEKPKGREKAHPGFKNGYELSGSALGKDGSRKEFFVYVGKADSNVALRVVLVADARETRLHKDLMRQICANIFRRQ